MASFQYLEIFVKDFPVIGFAACLADGTTGGRQE